MAADGRWPELFRSLLCDTGRLIRAGAEPEDELRVTTLLDLARELAIIAGMGHLDPAGLARVIDLEQRATSPGERLGIPLRVESDQPKVRVMTMHAAKGLEFGVVFIFGWFAEMRADPFYRYHAPDLHHAPAAQPGEGRADPRPWRIDLGGLPAAAELATDEMLAEEARLLYVAMTRAIGRVYLPYQATQPEKKAGLLATCFGDAIRRVYPAADEVGRTSATLRPRPGVVIRTTTEPTRAADRPDATPHRTGTVADSPTEPTGRPAVDAPAPRKAALAASAASAATSLRHPSAAALDLDLTPPPAEPPPAPQLIIPIRSFSTMLHAPTAPLHGAKPAFRAAGNAPGPGAGFADATAPAGSDRLPEVSARPATDAFSASPDPGELSTLPTLEDDREPGATANSHLPPPDDPMVDEGAESPVIAGIAATMAPPVTDAGLVPGPDELPRGVRVGTVFHALMEQIDYAAVRAAASADALLEPGSPTANLCQRLLQRLPIRRHPDPDDPRRLATLAWQALRTPLPGLDDLRLCDIPTNDRHHEVEFWLPTPGARCRHFLGLEIADDLLTGAIDLLLRVAGRWFIIDFKTNWQPPGGYRSEALTAVITGHHYDLQYLLYALATRRMLAGAGLIAGETDRTTGPGSTEVAAAVYLFVRGMSGAAGSPGVFTHRFAPDEIDAFERHTLPQWLGRATPASLTEAARDRGPAQRRSADA